jgi:two-component system sensor histidine kinase RegB
MIRPQITYDYRCQGAGSPPRLEVEITLEQAIENLLNNAANACPEKIGVNLNWDESQLIIRITDHGPGIPVELMDQLGKPVIRSGAGEGSGMGLGLLLSHATINRYGGRIKLHNRRQGGCEASITLPLEKI